MRCCFKAHYLQQRSAAHTVLRGVGDASMRAFQRHKSRPEKSIGVVHTVCAYGAHHMTKSSNQLNCYRCEKWLVWCLACDHTVRARHHSVPISAHARMINHPCARAHSHPFPSPKCRWRATSKRQRHSPTSRGGVNAQRNVN